MIQRLFDLKTLPRDDSVDAIAIGYAGLCGLRNNIGVERSRLLRLLGQIAPKPSGADG